MSRCMDCGDAATTTLVDSHDMPIATLCTQHYAEVMIFQRDLNDILKATEQLHTQAGSFHGEAEQGKQGIE